MYSIDSAGVSVSGTTSFLGNIAHGGGGAMFISSPDTFVVNGSSFVQNTASFGGAVAVTSSEQNQRTFEGCSFEENQASDGGALYFFTSAGLDLVRSSVFHGNYAGKWINFRHQESGRRLCSNAIDDCQEPCKVGVVLSGQIFCSDSQCSSIDQQP